jgi:TetR/AcrR family transcriptional regulator, transcriptional repressor for nem operon
MPRASEKRELLVEAGKRLIHRQGFQQTTLAEIARESGVPLGNMYYYFRTKEEILAAVAERLADDFRLRIARFEKEADPRMRLLAFLDSVIEARELIGEFGCPVGSLCQEVNKQGLLPRDTVNQALILRAEWTAEQFRLIGRNDAQELGVWLIGSVQGVILMANALKDPGVISRQIQQLKAWVGSL